jgi:hypothetical protein
MSASMKFFAASLVLTAGLCSSMAQAETLSPADIKKLAPGTYNVSVADSVRVRAVLTAKGGISVTTDKGEKDSGRWWLQGSKACVQFKKLLDKKPFCSSLSRDGNMLRGDSFTIRF